jgi:hypothetical protein
MLTQLTTVKSRLALDPVDTSCDAILTNTIAAVSARFDKETSRALARTENATHEFDPDDTQILVPCYPIESVSKFELKTSEAAGWQEVQPAPDFLIRRACIISLALPLNPQPSALNPALARLTYTAGYVLPGDPDPQPSANGPQPVRLPADLEQACVEQVAAWFQHREILGLDTSWPHGGTYQKFLQLPLLPQVAAVLRSHQRLLL